MSEHQSFGTIVLVIIAAIAFMVTGYLAADNYSAEHCTTTYEADC